MAKPRLRPASINFRPSNVGASWSNSKLLGFGVIDLRMARSDEVQLIDLSEAVLPAPIARRNQVIADAGRHDLADG
jgi:hypothetical protein